MNMPNMNEAPEGYPVWVESKLPGVPSGWHKIDEDGDFVDQNGLAWVKEDAGVTFVVHNPETLR